MRTRVATEIKPAGYQRIKQAQKEREKNLLQQIKRENAVGRGYDTLMFFTMAQWNALERLKAAGKIRLKKSKFYSKQGYWVVNKKKNG